MLTVDLAPATETRIRAFEATLRTKMAETGATPFAPASLYTILLLSQLLKLDVHDMLALTKPQEDLFPPTDPEQARILDAAVKQMRETHIAKREQAVEAITRKNHLQAEVDQLKRQVAALHRDATEALLVNDRVGAKALLQLRAKREETLVALRADLAAATEAANLVKRDIRQEEARLRRQTEEALAQATDQHAAQIVSYARGQLFEVYLSRPLRQDITVDSHIAASGEKTMRFDLELPEEAEAVIRAEAERRGLAPEEYVGRIIDGVAQLADLVTPQPRAQNALSDTYEETAEEIVAVAIAELRANQIRSRERAVKVMAQRNNLASELNKQKHVIGEFERKAMLARREGNQELALAFYQQKRFRELALERLLPMFAEAARLAEQTKSEIARDEERIRVRTAEAMLLQATQKAQATAFRFGAAINGIDFELPADLDADFERWAEGYEPPLPVIEDPRSFSFRDEDIEAALRILEERLKKKD